MYEKLHDCRSRRNCAKLFTFPFLGITYIIATPSWKVKRLITTTGKHAVPRAHLIQYTFDDGYRGIYPFSLLPRVLLFWQWSIRPLWPRPSRSWPGPVLAPLLLPSLPPTNHLLYSAPAAELPTCGCGETSPPAVRVFSFFHRTVLQTLLSQISRPIDTCCARQPPPIIRAASLRHIRL